MKVLVTGRHGQLVESLVERAREQDGIRIVTAGRPEADMETPGAIGAAIRAAAPDAVINAAAYTAVDLAEDEPDRAFRVNEDAACEVAAAAHGLGIPLIQISTDYVFDGGASRPYAEGAATNPLGVYGRSKLAGEQRVRGETGDHLILRTAWVYSPFGRNFAATMMRLARQSDRVSVVADQIGNPTSALDLADGLLHLLARWAGGYRTGLGETYHLAGSGEASWHRFAAEIFEQCARLRVPSAEAVPIRTEDWPTRAVRPRNSRLDSGKFARDFGFAMPAWQDSVRAIVPRLAGREDN